VAVTTPTPYAARRLPLIDPNVAKAMAIVTIYESTFRIISLYFENYVAEA
jgi:hypothetical protein